jgi:hypothetical protein
MIEGVLFRAERAECLAFHDALAFGLASSQGRAALADELGLLVARCVQYPAESRALWEHFETHNVKGTPDALRPHFEGFLRLLEGRGRIADSLLGLARERVLVEPSLSREVSLLEEASAALRSLREAELLQRLQTGGSLAAE